jgi:hypothetical protein
LELFSVRKMRGSPETGPAAHCGTSAIRADDEIGLNFEFVPVIKLVERR